MSDFDLDKMSEEDILRYDIDAENSVDEKVENTTTEEPVEETTEEIADESSEDTEDTDEEETSEESESTKVEDKDLSTFEIALGKLKSDGIDFKGTKVKIKDGDELLKLVQKGLGSNKRMQELKPKLKLMAMLEENGLASEATLNLIIDAVSKKDKSAFGKLLKDSNIDALDLEDSQYVSKDYSIPESQFDLQVLLDENKDSPVYGETITSIRDFDPASKDMIGKQPERFLTILADKESGVYSQIEGIVKAEQLKGNLLGIGFLAAYEQVVATIKENLAQAGHNTSTKQPNTSTSHNKKDSAQGTKQAKAVSSSSIGGGFGGKGKVYDLSKLSADELAKMPNTAFD